MNVHSCWSNFTITRPSRKKSIFINNTLYQLPRPLPFFTRVLKHAKKPFCKELAKKDKQSYDLGYGKRLQIPFYFAAKVIKATKFVSFHKRTDRYNGTWRPRHAEERCYYGFGPQRGPISQLVISCEKEISGEGAGRAGRVNHPVLNLKDLDWQHSVSVL